METLLKNDFTVHYGLPVSSINNISKQTNITYFELKDDVNLIYTTIGDGIAKYHNDNSLSVRVINYEAFIDSLPPVFTQNREKCDLIVYTDSSQYFLLNELTDNLAKYVDPFLNSNGHQQGKRVKAISQLKSSLVDLTDVLAIKTFIDNFKERRCCFFNRKPNTPSGIIAVTAFNRVNTISQNGFKMSNPDIETFGFILYEYSGEQTLTLQ
jgi:hypothetical protein